MNGFRKYLLIAFCFASGIGGLKAQVNTDRMIQIGRNALYFEDYVVSIQYFNSVIAAKPFLAKPYFYRALAKFYLDDYNGAEADASKALELNPFIGEAYELRGVTRQNLGKTDSAIADYDKALEGAPYNKDILFNKAMALDEVKRFEEARQVLDTLIKYNPGYPNAYVGRSRVQLELSDTIAAVADVDKAIEIDPNTVNAYIIRADIAIHGSSDYVKALEDMDRAIKLQPHYVGFYINRAFLKHELDDYTGAMADFDYALQLDPMNPIALFNRAMLRAEVHDYNRALEDLNSVEMINGADFRLLYNRAIIKNALRDYDGALYDIGNVIELYPELAAGYFLRYSIKKEKGDRSAKADYEKSIALASKKIQFVPDENGVVDIVTVGDDEDGESQSAVATRFTTLLTIDDNADVTSQYNNKSIRGRVQDRNAPSGLQPVYMLTYHSSPSELRPSGEYIREVDELNDLRYLRYLLQVTNSESSIDDEEQASIHFDNIEYYTALLSKTYVKAIDLFARGMEYMSVHDYNSALEDFNRVTDMQPDFSLGWFMKGVALLKRYELTDDKQFATATLSSVADAFEHTLALSPDMAIGHFNLGVVKAMSGDYDGAISSFDRAIELRPKFGEAFFNRGWCYYKIGKPQPGTADMSRAGELGVVPSYNLLKRMSR